MGDSWSFHIPKVNPVAPGSNGLGLNPFEYQLLAEYVPVSTLVVITIWNNQTY